MQAGRAAEFERGTDPRFFTESHADSQRSLRE